MSLIYILREDGQQEAHEENEVKDWLIRQELPPETLFWKEGMTDWRPLSDLVISRGSAFVPPRRTPSYGSGPETAVRSFQGLAAQDQPAVARSGRAPDDVEQTSRRKLARYRLRFNLLPLVICMQIFFACSMCVTGWYIYQCYDNVNNRGAAVPTDPMALLAGSSNTSGGGNAGVPLSERTFLYYFLLGLIGAHMVAEIMFFFWIYYANKNCRGMASNMIYTPGHAVACFFIPILNFFRPYSVVQELWKVSANPRGWIGRRGSIFVGFWFFVRLSVVILSKGAFHTSYSDSDDPGIRAIGTLIYLGTLETITLLIELTTIILVSVITWRQIKWAREAASLAAR